MRNTPAACNRQGMSLSCGLSSHYLFDKTSEQKCEHINTVYSTRIILTLSVTMFRMNRASGYIMLSTILEPRGGAPIAGGS